MTAPISNMGIYDKIQAFTTSPLGSILVRDIVKDIEKYVYRSSLVSLEQLFNMSPEEVDEILSRNIYNYDLNQPANEKLDQLIELHSSMLPYDEQVVLRSLYFKEYFLQSDADLSSSVISMGGVPRSRFENIKYLVRRRILKDLDKSLGTKRPKINWKQMVLIQYLFPKEYASAAVTLHKYSVWNRILIVSQMLIRNIPISPVNTFKGWSNQGVRINKGEKAIGIIVPRVYKSKDSKGEDDSWTSFSFQRRLFAQSQTSAANLPPLISEERFDLKKAIDTILTSRTPALSYQDMLKIYQTNGSDGLINSYSESIILEMLVDTVYSSHNWLYPTNDIGKEQVINLATDLIMITLGRVSDIMFPERSLQTLYSLDPKQIRKVSKISEEVLNAGYPPKQ